MSQPVFFVMPEWQGSASSRAMRLTEGAQLLREDLPTRARIDVPVPLEAGDALGTPVARLSSLIHARDSALTLLAEATGTPIIVGGDCASSLPGLEAAVRRHGSDNLAVLWFDAHPDLQHPSTSPSGAASGMTLRHALGDGSEDLRARNPISAERLVLVGTREHDPEETEELRRLGLSPIGISVFDALRTETAAATETAEAAAGLTALQQLAAVIAERVDGATHVYVHIDLDVLDPAEFGSVHAPVPFGLLVAELTGMLREVLGRVPLAGASICEFAPTNAETAGDDLPTVLRILAALTSGRTA
ncbi:arginase family protein [Leucobacter salsicius]|uniref:arginase family protein n=1 Tax=Leucobacter salsicius TaxID=664638 RepID=UPI00034A82B4|nr:arginase family protein [Leucobacter salsicius]